MRRKYKNVILLALLTGWSLSVQAASGQAQTGPERLSYVYCQTAYNTDGKMSAEELKGSDYWYTDMVNRGGA